MTQAGSRREYPAAVLDLYRKHRKGLLRLAEGIIECPAIAEDILHEAFVRFATRPDEEISNPVPYIYMTVRNIAIDVYRKQQRQRQIILPISGDLDIEALPDSSGNPETMAVWKQDHEVFQQALSELPIETRRAAQMHLIEKLTVRQVANQLDVSVGKAHQLITDGISQCRARLLGQTS